MSAILILVVVGLTIISLMFVRWGRMLLLYSMPVVFLTASTALGLLRSKEYFLTLFIVILIELVAAVALHRARVHRTIREKMAAQRSDEESTKTVTPAKPVPKQPIRVRIPREGGP